MLGYNVAQEAGKIDGLVRGFVLTRQGLIASSIKHPGLLEHRRAKTASKAVSASANPSEQGVVANLSTYLMQMQSASDMADGVAVGFSSPLNIWLDASFRLHNRDDNGDQWGSFGMVNLGADYLLSDKALVGLSLHYGGMSVPTSDDAELTGNGRLACPYASFEQGHGVFWDCSALYGGSSNEIDTSDLTGDFSTKRKIMETSIEVQWHFDDLTVLTPKLRAVYFSERTECYTVSTACGDELTIDGFDAEQFRVCLGAEIAKNFALEHGGILSPKLGLTGGVSGLERQEAFGQLNAGITMQTKNLWMLEAALRYNIEDAGRQF